MNKHNANNERIKRQYFRFLKEAKRQNEASVDAVAKALNRFEVYTRFRDFKSFHFNQAVAFKKHLAGEKNQKSGKNLSKATMHATLGHLKCFFQWLSDKPGYKSRIRYTDAEYFNLSEKDTRVATARRQKPVPTLEQVKHVISTMPTNSEIERRDRALIAFILLTGMRDGAIASVKLKHIDLVASSVFQDAREVNTKFSKTFTTYFFPVGDSIRNIVIDWVSYLRGEKLWGNEDPLFPATKVALGNARRFEAAGLERKHWSSATAIRGIFKKAFIDAGLPSFNPHSIRNTIVRLGEEVCQSPEHFKAWSQNLGHEGVLTTFTSYGEVSTRRQGEIIKNLESKGRFDLATVNEVTRAVIRELSLGSIR